MGNLNDLTARANALKAAGRMDEALAAYRAIVDIAPDNPIVAYNLAAALGDAGRHIEALDWGRRAIAAGMTAAETSLVIARSYCGLGDNTQAMSFFVDALNKRPTYTIAHKEFAQLVWMVTGNRNECLKALNTAIRAFPQAIDLRVARAQAIGHMGDASGEYAEMLEALKAAGGHPQLHLEAANSALAAGRSREALAHAKAAASIPDARLLLARAQLAVGEPQEAARVIDRLREDYPLDQFHIATQATCWRLLGDERYAALYDYDRFVGGYPLGCPKGWTSAEAYVDDLIAALDQRHRYLAHPFGQSLRGGAQLPSINRIDDPVFRAIEEALNGPINAYIARLGAGRDPVATRIKDGLRLVSIWSVRLASSGYHVSHVHPEGTVSSACHLRIVEPKDADDRSGWFTLGEPGVPTMPGLGPERYVRPQKGVIVLFPSYMWHGTVPFAGATSRLTIAADWAPPAM